MDKYTYCPKCMAFCKGSFCSECGTELVVPLTESDALKAIGIIVKEAEEKGKECTNSNHKGKEIYQGAMADLKNHCLSCLLVRYMAYYDIVVFLEAWRQRK